MTKLDPKAGLTTKTDVHAVVNKLAEIGSNTSNADLDSIANEASDDAVTASLDEWDGGID